ncbi:PIG-L family deacetylase [Pedobacter sp. PLR]|uniref:PIG-L deacetylase family protein n=1 Tax=Pedobacter sp. PLR TaxID=2994465 RepID=UPI002246BA58|nr:PIG-L family deacetylase [Pedobacter sp. PLR]MCX2452419.1 PIG-L family deacetylase [Pedobacter sp. PLR]
MENRKKVAVIVAHPDDETLWVGGTLLAHPDWESFILCLCRKNDPDRAAKFKKALAIFNAEGIMEDLDDEPMQSPQPIKHISDLVFKLLPASTYDLIITHNPLGEYTRHLRHEEVGKAVMNLWLEDKLRCKELLIFAYEDGNRMYFPRALSQANRYYVLPANLWQQKYNIMTEIYGFNQNSWEAKTVPTSEAFWRFTKKEAAINWLKNNSIL